MSLHSLLAVPAALLGILAALPVLLLGVPFWLVGWLTRRLAGLVSPGVVRWPELYTFDPALGWKARPNLDCHCLEEKDDVFHVRTDERGWPLGPPLAESRMVVVGDSHAFGYGVDHARTFFSRLPERLQVKAIGVPGYNLVQAVLLMERLAPELTGKLVVWFIYAGNDLHEALQPEMGGYRSPFVRQGNGDGKWEIVTSHLAPGRWTTSASARAKLYPILAALHSDSYLGERAYSACAFLLETARSISRRAGFDLVVLTIPAPLALTAPDDPALSLHVRRCRARMDPDYPDRRMGLACERLGIPFIPLKAHLGREDFKAVDDHWTERGHARVAEVLARLHATHVARPGVPAAGAAVPDQVGAGVGLG